VQFGHERDPFGIERRSSGFTSATTSGTSGSIAERRRLVDHDRSRRRGLRRPLLRERLVDVDDHEIETVETAGRNT